MHEKEFNTIVVNSIKETGGDAFKIPDAAGQGAMMRKSTTDGYGVIKREATYKPIYWESKYNKEFGAFSLKRIEDHQAYWLSMYSKIPDAEVYLILGMHLSRGKLYAYVFDWRYLEKLFAEKYSFWGKELETLAYNEVHKGIFELSNIIRGTK
jgi:penicillin-binding protein-related factor A (putative recombinase)